MSEAPARLLLVGGAGATLAALALHCVGADMAVVADSAAALDWLRGRAPVRPRLIVLDAATPAIAAAALKADADAGTIPLVVFCDEAALDACYRAGANACVVRPAAAAAMRETAGALVAFWLGANEAPPAPD